uniref:Interferon alpha-inducible protein 27-like protein 2B isoform X2 n=1 Tax=Crassostrea virginica TaxID=6565 RepID=A0A8B8BS94_CRAVI|nr:interferon alpha-inducible protein 27-like protein 2B isoform X2 [Crassostrea virginica]
MSSTMGLILFICLSFSMLPGVQGLVEVIAAVGVGAAAVVAAPAVLAGAGFTSAGVAAGSVAAMIQTPVTAAGSWFALSQSAGVLGMAATTKAAVGAVAGGITYVASLFV